MNKQDIIGVVSEQTGFTRGDATKAVEAVLDSIADALKRGEDVRLVGFGTFTVTRRKASTGRNPRTNQPMNIEASNQPKFRPGKSLKDALND